MVQTRTNIRSMSFDTIHWVRVQCSKKNFMTRGLKERSKENKVEGDRKLYTAPLWSFPAMAFTNSASSAAKASTNKWRRRAKATKMTETKTMATSRPSSALVVMNTQKEYVKKKKKKKMIEELKESKKGVRRDHLHAKLMEGAWFVCFSWHAIIFRHYNLKK